ncbi:helix-turn-helix domain-containing protein [Streptomyces rochei]|uniref:helix-turn-helix domain-containing protein n=1 Tax=Actinomycetes TaxID=1760 RepID=UPI0035DD5349
MKPRGPLIRDIRRARKMSLPELEAQTGLNRGYLSRLEREQIQDTGTEQVRKVATALRVDEDLIAEEEKKP